MAKVAEDAAMELPLNDERKPVKLNRHMAVALRNMKVERANLDKKIAVLTAQREQAHKAILEIEPE